MIKLPENVMFSESVPYCKITYSFEADADKLPQVTTPEEAYTYLMEIWDRDTISYKEEFLVLLLNINKVCLGWSRISSGGSSATIVDPAMIAQLALLTHADSVILAHNHPSGKLKPSRADIHLTNRIAGSLKLLGITVNDHIILTANSFYSFNEHDLIRPKLSFL